MLDEAQLFDLLDFLDERLPHAGCDHTLRLTERWAKERWVDPRGLIASLERFGGYCDCEVLANVDPESIF